MNPLLKMLREANQAMLATITGLESKAGKQGAAGEELMKLIGPVKTELTAALQALPESKSDEGDEAAFAAGLVAMQRTQTQMASAAEGLTAQLAALDARVAEAVEAKVKTGELVPKPAHEAQVAAARKEETDRFALVSKRRGELVTAGLPAPVDENLLLGEDADYGKRRTAAVERCEWMKKQSGLQPGLVAQFAWAPEPEFAASKQLVEQAVAGARKGNGFEPLAGGTGAGGKGKIWL